MFWNKSFLIDSNELGSAINFNMGCFETTYIDRQGGMKDRINFNMGCFETNNVKQQKKRVTD